MIYIGIVNLGDFLTKSHSGYWDPDDLEALSVDFAFFPWSVGRFRH
jgi:hypothetical protein